MCGMEELSEFPKEKCFYREGENKNPCHTNKDSTHHLKKKTKNKNQ